jgi:hypothetical protein
MRALALLLTAAVVACSNDRPGQRLESRSEDPMPLITGGSVVRRTTLRLPSAQEGVDLDGARGFTATQRCALGTGGKWFACHVPPLDAAGPQRVAMADLTANPPAVVIEPGVLADGGAPVVTGPRGSKLAGGTELPAASDAALGPSQYVEASWHAPLATADPLLRLGRIRGAGKWTLDAYDATRATRRWTTGASQLPGEPVGVAIAPDGSSAYLALRNAGVEAAFDLVALDGAAGTPRWRAPLAGTPTGLILPSADGAGLAVLVRDPARCASCLKIVVVPARDGRSAREVALPAESIAEGATSAGFSGEAVWFYRYVAAHATSELAPAGRTRVPAACTYEVHDLRAADLPPRTLRDAEGDWRDIAAPCQVRTVIPLAAGHVAAVQVTGPDELTLVEFDAAP